MATLLKQNSVRVNMFEPDVQNEAIMEKVNLLLRQIDMDNANYCPLHLERMARSVAGVVTNFKSIYGLAIEDIEEKYGFKDFRKSFACNDINLCEIAVGVCTPIDSVYDTVLTTESFVPIGDNEDNIFIIKI